MGRTNRPDTLLSELTALKKRIAQLETQQRLSSARISSGQLNVGAVGASGQIEIDATDEQIRILRDGKVIAALSTAEGLFLAGYTGDDLTTNGINLQPVNGVNNDFAPAQIFTKTYTDIGENQTWITSAADRNISENLAGILLRGSDSTNGDKSSVYLDADTTQVAGTFSAGNIAVGSTSITPTTGGTPASKAVTYGPLTGTTFFGFITAATTVPGPTVGTNGVTGVGITSVTSTGATLWVNRQNTTATTVNYLIFGV